LPISIKGIIIYDNKVLLLKNERNEWELPGGRLEPDETPEQCVIREIKEELNIFCSVKKLVDVWVYKVFSDRNVFIVTYLCECLGRPQIVISDEYMDYKWLDISKMESINMPYGYKRSISKVISP
jgi:mutator protein MutT